MTIITAKTPGFGLQWLARRGQYRFERNCRYNYRLTTFFSINRGAGLILAGDPFNMSDTQSSMTRNAEAERTSGAAPIVSEPSEHRLVPDERIVVYSSRSDIRSPSRLFGGMYRDFMEGREIAWRLFVRNLHGMYRQTLLGLFWAFLPPIANTAMWVFLKNVGAFDMGETAVNGTVFILTGMIFWQAFVEAFNMPLQKIKANQNMLSRLRFPRESLLLVGIGEVLFNLGIRLLLLIPAFIYFQVPLHIEILYAPIAVLGLVALGAGMGLVVMPIGTLYQDVSRFITMLIPFWMIITPIIYVPRTEGMGTLLNWVNPASPLLILARDWCLIGASPHTQTGLFFLGLAIPLLVFGLVIYRVSLPVLIERMKA